MNSIGSINLALSNPNTPGFIRPALENSLSTASKALDLSEKFVPRVPQ